MLNIKLCKVDSTSKFLANFLQHYKSLMPVSCVSKQQTDGYGQYGRRWESDLGSLTFTLAIPLHDKTVKPWFSFLIACAIRDFLTKYTRQFFTVKWPNDIYNSDGKICGCIIEIVKNYNGERFLSIGVGINTVLLNQKFGYKASFVELNCPDIFLKELTQFLADESLLKKTVFDQYLKSLPEVDFFKMGQRVIVYDCDLVLRGVYLGLNQDGFPLIEIEGSQMLFNSGRTSIRPA